MIRLTRRYRFCSSHRLHSEALSEEQNQQAYGKCNNPYGHGHNYLLEVTVGGQLDAATGRVVAIESLDALVHECVLREFDHHDLNSEVPEFAALVPTSENLAVVIEERLHRNWNDRLAPAHLDNVRLHETRRNRFDLKDLFTQ